ncbi:Spg4p KNAG_0E02370 [Huiozyma naganishii CBS 8797]|uniref:Stationary phase protein 4 n=1 Tax=Huiozyma naganishii (strain ATCC MYA-139 / BCRC 22969 / CBS 8797 / KCTC 17520 / NBRC 10181 / NCYC 3082 / Yp74L-3) TaxID=1071383 RepID=J7RLU1_HUIN7|nr:hypothetical protein KNAG_0E02370 [Kazachstania naganishii CBS 8797]CCK70498.1 hypothetical protein KNAG_0E02370 [Kazachstania naganishii CBS 8797]
MSSIWDAFQVYNRNKHDKRPEMRGMNHVNTGVTQVLYAKEHRPPPLKQTITAPEGATTTTTTDGHQPPPLDDKTREAISKMTRGEFERLRADLRRGEPDNRVNF